MTPRQHRFALATVLFCVSLLGTAAAEDEGPALSAKGRAIVLVESKRINTVDVNWLMWRFGRDKTERADWQSLTAWLSSRKVAQTRSMKTRIDARAEPGLDASGLAQACYDDLVCAQLDLLFTNAVTFRSARELKSAITEAAPYFRAYGNAIETAMEEPPVYVTEGSAMRDKLAARRFRDQMWIKVVFKPDSMSGAAKSVLMSQTGATFVQTSFDNQTFVAAEVMTAGWPPISTFGKAEAHDVWLIVQHSDHVPDFQLKALQAMRPLLERGEVSRSNYAYLYDRVRVNVGQKQRYGSQFECRDGRMVPKPLEAPEQIDALRKEMDLEPLADYAKKFRANCGR